MKPKIKILPIILFPLFLAQCNSNKTPYCKISGVNNNQTVFQSDILEIDIEFGDNDGRVIDSRLYIDSLKVNFLNLDTLESGNYICHFNWNTKNLNVGEHILMASVTDNEGEMNYEFLTIEVVKTGPEVLTNEAIVVSPFIAIMDGTIAIKGSSTIYQLGFYWSKSNPEPDATDNIELTDESINKFYAELQNLEPNTTYYCRAFVENDVAFTSGNVKSFKTKAYISPEIVNGEYTDQRDGNTYKVTTIGRQTWMAENLVYLPQVDPPSTSSSTEAAYYVYEYNGTQLDEAVSMDNYQKYGVLYNWPAAIKACPSSDGWHLPTYSEWYELGKYISYEHIDDPEHSRYDFNIGKYLKAVSGWEQDTSSNDMYHFCALPAGIKDHNGFYALGEYAIWLSSSEANEQEIKTSQLHVSSNSFQQNSYLKENGYSIRCIKD